MAYISLAGKRDTDPAETANKRDLSDDDYNRVALWAATKYFPAGVTQDDGTQRAPTGVEVFTALTNDIYEKIKIECEAWYLAQAEAAARASVQPIVLTPVQ
jgi:hypothetical protein